MSTLEMVGKDQDLLGYTRSGWHAGNRVSKLLLQMKPVHASCTVSIFSRCQQCCAQAALSNRKAFDAGHNRKASDLATLPPYFHANHRSQTT